MKQRKVDCLFIHPSALFNLPKYIMVPMGMIGLMNELKKRKRSVQMFNHGLEMALDSSFSIKRAIIDRMPKVVAIDLHWHEHAFSSIKIAQLCKEISSEILVVLGGFTASYFADEIVGDFPYIDVIIIGDADILFPEFIDYYLDNGVIPSHNKIVSRKKDKNHQLQISSVTDESFDNMDFVDITSMSNWTYYLKSNIDRPQKSWFWNNIWFPIARGCNNDCSYCGGGYKAQESIFRRKGLIFRNSSKVVQDIKFLESQGIHIINFSHDPQIAGQTYWKRIFRGIRENGLEIGAYIEIWQLPLQNFLMEVVETFNLNFTTLAITVLTGNEEIRRKNGKNFGNDDLFNALDNMESLGVSYTLFFSSGLPFETTETVQEGFELLDYIMKYYHPKNIFCTTLTLDPFSPMKVDSEYYRTDIRFDSFHDYYHRTQQRSNDENYDLLGYQTQTMDQQAIIQQQERWNQLLRQYAPQFLSNSSLFQLSNSL